MPNIALLTSSPALDQAFDFMRTSSLRLLLIPLLWITHTVFSLAQPLNIAWQGLPSSYNDTRNWNITGQGDHGLWIRLKRKQDQRLEYRNLRLQLQQAITLPSYLNQTGLIHVLKTDTGTQLVFDLIRADAGDHGLFISKIPKDSSKIDPAKLLFETTENDKNQILDFKLIKNRNHPNRPESQNDCIIHSSLSRNDFVLKYRRIDRDTGQPQTYTLTLNAATLGLQQNIILTEVMELTKIQDDMFGFLFQYRASSKDRKKTLWGLGIANFKEHLMVAISLNRYGIDDQMLHIDPTTNQDSLSIHGYVMDERNKWPFGSITYRLRLPYQNTLVEPVSQVYPFPKETNQQLLNLKINEGNVSNRFDESYSKLHIHEDQSSTLFWRRRYKSSETLVQYSQGMPMYREIIRYHANEWVITHLDQDGTPLWHQIVPMNLTINDRNYPLETHTQVVGQAMLLVGYQNMNNRVSPFVLQVLPDGRVINPDTGNRLKGQSPKWSGLYSIDANNSVVPSRSNGREGLLYLHFARP